MCLKLDKSQTEFDSKMYGVLSSNNPDKVMFRSLRRMPFFDSIIQMFSHAAYGRTKTTSSNPSTQTTSQTPSHNNNRTRDSNKCPTSLPRPGTTSHPCPHGPSLNSPHCDDDEQVLINQCLIHKPKSRIPTSFLKRKEVHIRKQLDDRLKGVVSTDFPFRIVTGTVRTGPNEKVLVRDRVKIERAWTIG